MEQTDYQLKKHVLEHFFWCMLAWRDLFAFSSFKPLFAENIMTQVHVMKSLEHTNIVRYLGTERGSGGGGGGGGASSPSLVIFLEYVPGGSVRSLLDRFGAFDEAVVRIYARQILMGLDYLHTHGIAHRDIKV